MSFDLFGLLRRWNNQRQTVTALERLSNRELADLGIARSQIREVARRSVI